MSIDPGLLDGLHRDLRDKLAEFTSSDEWLQWLHGARQFHRYSPTNQLLLMLQGARGHVASYRTWQRIPAVDGGHCQVRRGEHGLTIVAPLTVTRRDVDEASGDEVVVGAIKGFRPVKVFHQAQLVSPPAIPEQPMPAVLDGPDRWQHVWTAVAAQLNAEGYEIELHTAGPGEEWNGRTHFGDGYVEVMDHLGPPQRVKTLLHEWPHVALRHGDIDASAARELREIEAESVAYLLCQTVRLDSSSYSIPYLAGWSSGDGELAETTAQRILTVTAAMVGVLESKLSIDLTPDLFTVTDRAATALTAHERRGPLEPAPSSGSLPAPSPHLTIVPDPHVLVEETTDPTIEQAPTALRALLARLDPGDRPVLLGAVGRLADHHGRAVAVALCADAGFDAAQTAATLTAVNADPAALRRSMKQAVADVDGQRRFLFDNVDAAFRIGPVPAGLDPTDAALLEDVDVDDPAQVRAAVQLLHQGGAYRSHEISAALTHLGVTADDIHTALSAVGLTTAPASDVTDSHAAGTDTLEVLRQRLNEHQTLLRRVVDEGRDPNRVTALAAGLGMTFTETVTVCANVGLDPAFTAQVALARRDGQITDAASDLVAGWTADPPDDGWAPYLTAVDTEQANIDPNLPSGEAAARAVLAHWRQAATRQTPTPAMT